MRAALQARCLRANDPSLRTLEIKGRKIIVSVDGGRLRIRENKKGPKTDNNRTRYSTEWREPKLLCIYFLDENGEVDRSIPPILDGTMAHVDEIFKMLCDYLAMLPIDSDTEVLFISDGADCLWKRVSLVEKTVREKGGRFRSLLDYYHMKGYLHEMAKAAKGWTKKKRTQWIHRMTGFLFSGDNGSFEREVESLQKSSRKGSVNERQLLVEAFARRAHELRRGEGAKIPDRQRRDRKHGASGGQSAVVAGGTQCYYQ